MGQHGRPTHPDINASRVMGPESSNDHEGAGLAILLNDTQATLHRVLNNTKVKECSIIIEIVNNVNSIKNICFGLRNVKSAQYHMDRAK